MKQIPYKKIYLLQGISEQSGVYWIYNQKKQIIYIGKAENLRQRLIQHLLSNEPNRLLLSYLTCGGCAVSFKLCGMGTLDLEETKALHKYYLKNRRYPICNNKVPY